jgi:hypothetical protein
MKNRLQGSKSDVKVSDLASNATHAHTIDVKGFSQASIDVAFEPVAAAGTNSAVANVLTLQHGDTTSSFAAVTGFVAGTDYTLPTPSNTNDTTVVRFDIDLAGKKRYLKVNVTPKADSAVTTAVRLAVSENGIDSASETGASVIVDG